MPAREGKDNNSKEATCNETDCCSGRERQAASSRSKKNCQLVTEIHRVDNFPGNNNCTCFDIPFVENRRISTLDNGFIASPVFVNVSLLMCSTAAGVVDVVGLWLSLLQRKEEYIL